MVNHLPASIHHADTISAGPKERVHPLDFSGELGMNQQLAPQQAHTSGRTVALRLALFVLGMTALMIVVKFLVAK